MAEATPMTSGRYHLPACRCGPTPAEQKEYSAPMLARWAVRLAACLVVAAVSSCGTGLWLVTQWVVTPREPAVPLTAGLSGEWKTVSTEFDRRVKASFPLGSSVKEMGRTLGRQGFSRQDWSSSIEHEHKAMRREDGFVCRQAAYVNWRADADDRLISVNGIYREEGCL